MERELLEIDRDIKQCFDQLLHLINKRERFFSPKKLKSGNVRKLIILRTPEEAQKLYEEKIGEPLPYGNPPPEDPSLYPILAFYKKTGVMWTVDVDLFWFRFPGLMVNVVEE